MFTKTFRVAVLAVLLIAGCATQGDAVRIGITMPDGERATIVAHNQSVPNWMLARESLALNFIVKGDVSAKQLAAVAETERACRIYTGTVRPNQLVAVLSSGVLYAIAGGIGVGLASQAYPRAVMSEYARYGATTGGFAGMANGVVNLGGQTYTFENCGAGVLSLFPGYDVRVIR